MPTPTSGLRVARSTLSPAASVVLTAELDFQLAPNGAIEIFGVLGVVPFLDDESPDSGVAVRQFSQSLHMETDSLENVPIAAGDDEVNVDTEVFWEQAGHLGVEDDGVNGVGYAHTLMSPTGIVTFPMSLISARNITHRAELTDADMSAVMTAYIYYRYVRLTRSEMGFFLARRI